MTINAGPGSTSIATPARSTVKPTTATMRRFACLSVWTTTPFMRIARQDSAAGRLLQNFPPPFELSQLIFAYFLKAVLQSMADQIGHVARRIEPGKVDEIGAFFVQRERALDGIRGDEHLRLRAAVPRLLKNPAVGGAAKDAVRERRQEDARGLDVRMMERVHIGDVAVHAADAAASELLKDHGIEVDHQNLPQRRFRARVLRQELQLLEDRARLAEEAEEDDAIFLLDFLLLLLGRPEFLEAESSQARGDPSLDHVVVHDEVRRQHRRDREDERQRRDQLRGDVL